jgi:hypothetical protein
MWYPSDKILKLIVNVSQNYCSNCEVHSLAKYIKLSFCNSNFKSNEKFEHVKYLLKDKKLILVLDLDHTLVNSVFNDQLTEEEEYLLDEIMMIEGKT